MGSMVLDQNARTADTTRPFVSLALHTYSKVFQGGLACGLLVYTDASALLHSECKLHHSGARKADSGVRCCGSRSEPAATTECEAAAPLVALAPSRVPASGVTQLQRRGANGAHGCAHHE